MEPADERTVDDALKFFRIVFEKTAAHPEGWVTNQNVDSAGRLNRLLHERLAPTPRKDVGLDDRACPAQRPDFVGSGVDVRTSGTVVDDHLGTVTGQFHGAAFSNSAARPRHESGFVHEFHVVSPIVGDVGLQGETFFGCRFSITVLIWHACV